MDLFPRPSVRKRVPVAQSAQATGGDSTDAWISAEGRAIVFTSTADNLVIGDNNAVADIFLRDRGAGTTDRMSISLFAQQATGASGTAQITPDGRFVIFQSAASNLVSGDTNNTLDIFLRDRVSGSIEPVSVSSGGVGANGSSFNAAVSADGSVVAFMSEATNLVPNIPFIVNAIYRRDRLRGETTRVNVAATGESPNNLDNFCAVSGDGQFVGFASFATNLVPFDNNGRSDIFVVSSVVVPATRQAVFNPATGEWAVRGDDGSTSTVQFGAPGDVPVPADYLGLGRAQIAVYRPSTGQWLVRSEGGKPLDPVVWGDAGSIPVPGDYVGTGRAQIAIFSPSTGNWLVRVPTEEPGLGNTGGVILTAFGKEGDIPVSADYNGLGKIQRAVYRPSTRDWIMLDPRAGVVLTLFIGETGDIPVPGDYFGLGRAIVAAYKPSTGEWTLRHDDGQLTKIRPTIGAAEFIPVPGDYLGQGRDQPALFIPSTRTWVVNDGNLNALIPFGGPGSQPIPAPWPSRF